MPRSTTSFRPQVHQLESRLVPATLVSPTTVSYLDVDGDPVTVVFSHPILTSVDAANSIFLFDQGSVDGAAGVKQQLQLIYLEGLANGLSVKVTAKKATGGDGFAHVGDLYAWGQDMHTVTIDGDLARINVGDDNFSTAGLLALNVDSMGVKGASTMAPDQNLYSNVQGRLGSVNVKRDYQGIMTVRGGAQAKLDNLIIGGSMRAVGNEAFSAHLQTEGDLVKARIKGDIIGGGGHDSGMVLSRGRIESIRVDGNVQGGAELYSGVIYADGKLVSAQVNGSVIGAAGITSGSIFSFSDTVGQVKIGGSLLGGSGPSTGRVSGIKGIESVTVTGQVRGGTGNNSGVITTNAVVGKVAIGSLAGGTGEGSGKVLSATVVTVAGNVSGGNGEGSGSIHATSNASVKIAGSLLGGSGPGSGSVGISTGTVQISGDVRGGAGDGTGNVRSGEAYNLINVSIGGSLIGGSGQRSGVVHSSVLGTVTIGRDVIGGNVSGTNSLEQSGHVDSSTAIHKLVIGGSIIAGRNTGTGTLVDSGSIRADNDIRSMLVKGNLLGNASNRVSIIARGMIFQGPLTNVAIHDLRVKGRAEFARIVTGYSTIGPQDGNAQIGSVRVDGDWVASDLATGAEPGDDGQYGTEDDRVIPNTHPMLASIASVTIGGKVRGPLVGGGHYGIVAEQIVTLKIGGKLVTLTADAHNDDKLLDALGAVTLLEL